MAEYTFQTLRNNRIFDSRQDAVNFLNAFKYHKVCQPIALRYHQLTENNDPDAIGVVFALGVKEGNGSTCGSDHYRIIEGGSGGGMEMLRLTFEKDGREEQQVISYNGSTAVEEIVNTDDNVEWNHVVLE